MKKVNILGFILLLIGTLGGVATGAYGAYWGIRAILYGVGALNTTGFALLGGIFLGPVLVIIGLVIMAICIAYLILHAVFASINFKHLKEPRRTGYAITLIILSIIFAFIFYLYAYIVTSEGGDSINYIFMVAPIVNILGSIFALTGKKVEPAVK